MITIENVCEGLKVSDTKLKVSGYISECHDVLNVFVIYTNEHNKMIGSGFYCVDTNNKNYSKELIKLEEK